MQETMERAIAQEETENSYHELAHLAETCLTLFGNIQPGDVVTTDVANECKHLMTRLEELLTRHKEVHAEEASKR
jgi:hypothetical protein